MRIDETVPGFFSREEHLADLERIAKYVGSPKSRNYKTKLKVVRAKPARDYDNYEGIGEHNSIHPAYRVIR